MDYDPGDPWPEHADLFVGGGGRDWGRPRGRGPRGRGARLHEAVERGVPMLRSAVSTSSSPQLPHRGGGDPVRIGARPRNRTGRNG
ncbi:hypothetical protein QJS66_04310 [Kocuria rhizophila]|nr:hypothetical protein QJS66_04310 [Kocuria rhizophila]